jgi:hypothetical protein
VKAGESYDVTSSEKRADADIPTQKEGDRSRHKCTDSDKSKSREANRGNTQPDRSSHKQTEANRSNASTGRSTERTWGKASRAGKRQDMVDKT